MTQSQGEVQVSLEQPDDAVAEDIGLERPAGVRDVELLIPSSTMEAGSYGNSGQSVSGSGRFYYGAPS